MVRKTTEQSNCTLIVSKTKLNSKLFNMMHKVNISWLLSVQFSYPGYQPKAGLFVTQAQK